LVGVSYDPPKVLRNFAEKQGITYPLLSDEDSRVIRGYGILNREMIGGQFEGVPHPGTFLVDGDGVVVAKLFREGYRERHGPEELIQSARGARTETGGGAPGAE